MQKNNKNDISFLRIFVDLASCIWPLKKDFKVSENGVAFCDGGSVKSKGSQVVR